MTGWSVVSFRLRKPWVTPLAGNLLMSLRRLLHSEFSYCSLSSSFHHFIIQLFVVRHRRRAQPCQWNWWVSLFECGVKMLTSRFRFMVITVPTICSCLASSRQMSHEPEWPSFHLLLVALVPYFNVWFLERHPRLRWQWNAHRPCRLPLTPTTWASVLRAKGRGENGKW